MAIRKWPHVVDWLLNLCIFFPCMIAYRRGIWDLLTYYIYPGRDPFSHWVITGIGCIFFLAFYLYPLMDKFLLTKPNWVRAIGIRFALVVGGIFALAYWRGVWGLADYYLNDYGWKAGAVGFVISYGIPMLCQTSRTIVFPPFVLLVDQRKTVLEPVTMLRFELSWDLKGFICYTLDCLLTHFFNLTLTVLAWRSLLTMQMAIPWPAEYSDIIDFFIGFGFIILMFLLEIPLAMLLRFLTESSSDCKTVTTAPNVSGNGPVELSREESRSNTECDISDSTMDSPTSLGPLQRPPSSNTLPRTPRAFVYRGLSKKEWIKLIFYDFIFLIAFMGEGFIWLGLWNLDVTYLFPDKMKGGWLNHCVGMVLLIILQIMSYGGACGCAFDLSFADEEDQKNEFGLYLYPNYFVRLFLKERKNRIKQNKDRNVNKNSEMVAVGKDISV